MHRTLALAFALLISCKAEKAKTGSGSSAAPAPSPSPAAPTAPTAEQPPAEKPVPTEEAKLAFELNGKPAMTTLSKSDIDKQNGIVNGQKDLLIMTLYGGASDWSRRGAIMITAKPFAYAPGKLANASAQLNTGDVIYQGPLTFEITSLNEIGSQGSGRRWKAAGTFSGELTPAPGAKADVPTMKITNGTFSDVPLQEINKKS